MCLSKNSSNSDEMVEIPVEEQVPPEYEETLPLEEETECTILHPQQVSSTPL